MTQRRHASDKTTRVDAATLLSAADRLLSAHGPSALTARKIADAAGTSTMAIYSRFGATAGLHRSLRRDGFGRLANLTTVAARSDDPVAALAAASSAYLDFGVAEPHLYRFMFVDADPAASDETRVEPGDVAGREAFATVRNLLRACIAAERFAAVDDDLVTIWAAQVWALQHGTTTLALTGTVAPDLAHDVLEDGLLRLCIGYGDDATRAEASIAAA
ncbi:TetR/AcrR family transcriptional regulator [Gordonia sinesedis]